MHNNIMAAGLRDRPPMLATGRYAQWRSRFLRYIDTRPDDDALRKCILEGPYIPTIVTTPVVLATENSSAVPEQTTVETTAQEMQEAIESYNKDESLNIKMSSKLIWEYCPITSHDGETIESRCAILQQLQPEWSIFVTIVKQQHKLDEVSYHKLFDILKQYQKEVNELRAERMAKNANPLALVATAQTLQDPYYQSSKPHKSYAPTSKASLPTRSHATTRYKGKEIAKPITPPSESASEEDSDPEQAQRDKDMQKNLALIAKLMTYSPTSGNREPTSIRITPNSDLNQDRPSLYQQIGAHPRRSRATKPLDRSPSRPLEAPIRHMIWSSQRRDRPWGQPSQPPQSQSRNLQRATSPPLLNAPGTNTTEPPPPPLRNKGPELGGGGGATTFTLEGVATELAPSDFVSQNYETLVALMQEETKKRSSQSLQARLNFGPEDEVSPPRHRKERRGKDNRRPPVFGRIGKQVSGTQTANLQNLDTHENNDRRISVRDRLGSRDVHSRPWTIALPSESLQVQTRGQSAQAPQKSKLVLRRYLGQRGRRNGTLEIQEQISLREDHDYFPAMASSKVDAYTRRISNFYGGKEKRMPLM
ncbi:hypothetical protein Tco_1303909 [Tanacetum coccineum]